MIWLYHWKVERMNKKYSNHIICSYGCDNGAYYYANLAPVNAASSAVQTLNGGAVAMAYVSTALNKMGNSEQGQQESLARTRRKTGYLNDSAAQARATYPENVRGFSRA